MSSNNSINSSTFTGVELSLIAMGLYLVISPIHGVSKVTKPLLKMLNIKTPTSLLLFTGLLFGVIYYFSIELVLGPLYKKMKTTGFKVGGSGGLFGGSVIDILKALSKSDNSVAAEAALDRVGRRDESGIERGADGVDCDLWAFADATNAANCPDAPQGGWVPSSCPAECAAVITSWVTACGARGEKQATQGYKQTNDLLNGQLDSFAELCALQHEHGAHGATPPLDGVGAAAAGLVTAGGVTALGDLATVEEELETDVRGLEAKGEWFEARAEAKLNDMKTDALDLEGDAEDALTDLGTDVLNRMEGLVGLEGDGHGGNWR